MIENERGRGSSSQNPSFENNTNSQDQSANRRSHESLVQAFRDYVHEYDQRYEGAYSPAHIIRLRLITEESQSLNTIARISPIEEKENNFFGNFDQPGMSLRIITMSQGQVTRMRPAPRCGIIIDNPTNPRLNLRIQHKCRLLML
jgi:hypothetical protein